MRVVVTGHRPNKLPGKYNWAHPSNVDIMKWMTKQLRLFKYHYDEHITACTGMALGVDQMFAHVCLALAVNYIAFVPCKGQEKVWPAYSQKEYKKYLETASKVIYVHDEPYYDGCMQERNRAMRDWALEDKASALLAVWNGTPGGTANMIKICKSKKIEIISYEVQR